MKFEKRNNKELSEMEKAREDNFFGHIFFEQPKFYNSKGANRFRDIKKQKRGKK